MTYPVFFASKSAARVSEEASDLSDRQSQEQDQHKLHTRGEYYRTRIFFTALLSLQLLPAG